MAKRVSTSYSSSDTQSKTHSETASQSESRSQSETRKILDEQTRDKILAGLLGTMSEAEISAYAENLLRPQLSAGLEAAQQQYEAAEMARRQEMESLEAALERSVEEQKEIYGRSMADVQTAALARGMGRSSYTIETLAGQSRALSKAVDALRRDTTRQQNQLQQQIGLAAQQKAQTTGRLNTDYAANLAAKVQELKQAQREEYNRNYLSAVSGSMGSMSTGLSNTTGSSKTDSQTQSHTSGYSQTITETKR